MTAILTLFAIYTQPFIEKNAQEALKNAISEVLPDIAAYNEVTKEDNFRIYEGKTSSGGTLGYAIYTSGAGFQDKIVVIFGVDKDFSNILSLKVLEQKETPGLGAKIMDENAFLQFWKNKSLAKELTYAKPAKPKANLGESEINAISGATISSKAVVGIINGAITVAKKKLGGRS
jgi:electron transport complex protein RnfG